MKYHLTDNGPKPCTASVRDCPIGGAHFENVKEAEEGFHSKMGGAFSKASPKIFAPPKPEIERVTDDEVDEAMERVRSYLNRIEFTRSPVVYGKVVSYTLLGSSLYGLNTPNSDRDLLVLTDEEHGIDVHKVFDDGLDVRVSSVFRFAQNASEGHPNSVDVIQSGHLEFRNDSYAPYYNAVRFDKISYLAKVSQHSRKEFKRTIESVEIGRSRADKNLKSGLRAVYLIPRVERDGLNFKTYFDAQEREDFYRSYETLIAMRDSGGDHRALEEKAYLDACTSAKVEPGFIDKLN